MPSCLFVYFWYFAEYVKVACVWYVVGNVKRVVWIENVMVASESWPELQISLLNLQVKGRDFLFLVPSLVFIMVEMCRLSLKHQC